MFVQTHKNINDFKAEFPTENEYEDNFRSYESDFVPESQHSAVDAEESIQSNSIPSGKRHIPEQSKTTQSFNRIPNSWGDYPYGDLEIKIPHPYDKDELKHVSWATYVSVSRKQGSCIIKKRLGVYTCPNCSSCI